MNSPTNSYPGEQPRAWVDTGVTEHVDNPFDINRVPPFDARSGDHFWIVMTTYRVDPVAFSSPDPAITPMLDHESLVTVGGPGCFYCEQLYSPLLASRRCRGPA